LRQSLGSGRDRQHSKRHEQGALHSNSPMGMNEPLQRRQSLLVPEWIRRLECEGLSARCP
jgi:hypothetical protein